MPAGVERLVMIFGGHEYLLHNFPQHMFFFVLVTDARTHVCVCM